VEIVQLEISTLTLLTNSTKNIILNGAYAQKYFPGLLGKATNLSRKLRDEYNKALDSYDVLILPNLPYVANSHAKPDATPLDHLQKQVSTALSQRPSISPRGGLIDSQPPQFHRSASLRTQPLSIKVDIPSLRCLLACFLSSKVPWRTVARSCR